MDQSCAYPIGRRGQAFGETRCVVEDKESLLELYTIDRELIAGLLQRLEHRMTIDLSVTDRHLFLSVGEPTLSGDVTRIALD